MEIPKPCTGIIVDGKEVELFRCETDGAVVFNHQEMLKLHPGHRFRAPVILKAGEAEEIASMYTELKKEKTSLPEAV